MAQSRPTETELKFLVSPEAAAALLSHAALRAPERTERLRSVYYDTAGWDLHRRRMALRLREKGGERIQTLKHDAGGGALSRGEWERPVDHDGLDMAALAETPAAEVLEADGARLEPVFVTSVERNLRRCATGGAVIEVAYDLGEIEAGERRAPIRELELELKRGEGAALFDLARRLAAEVDIRLSFESKSDRGYRLADGAELEPRKAEPLELEPEMPAAAAFRALAMSCLGQAAANAEILCERSRPEALHQLRVGMRRLRSMTKAFEPMLRGDDGEGVERELKWLAGELDPARDIDVLISDSYGPALGRLAEAGLAGLGKRLLEAQTRAYARAGEAVRSRRCSRLWLDAAAWIEAGAWTRSEEPIAARLREQPIGTYAARALDHLRKVVRKRARRWDRMDARARHKLRIRVKRLRYAAEALGPLFAGGKRRRRFMAALKRLQGCLGELNDMAVMRGDGLARLGTDDPSAAFAIGRLVGWREAGEPALLEATRGAVEDFCETRRFWGSRTPVS